MAERKAEAVTPERRRRQELRGTSRLRSDELPAETLVLLRGGAEGVQRLLTSAQRAGERYSLDGAPFYGLCIAAALPGETEPDRLGELSLSAYPQYYRTTAGALHEAGFRVWATFTNPHHYSVQLHSGTLSGLRRLLAVAGPLIENPRYVPDE